jgi:subtilase family serine protease
MRRRLPSTYLMARGLRMGPRGVRRWPLAAAAAAALIAATGTAPALAARSSRAFAAHSTGALPSSQRMRVTIVLKARDTAGLARYAREVSTPGSSIYHDYLTPAEFAARFGASAAVVRAVQASMRAHGVIAGPPSANRLAIPVVGKAAQIGRAFAISFRRLAAADGKHAVAASSAPALDRGIAGDVQAVVGLSSVAPPRPLMERPLADRATARTARALRASSGGPHACTAATGAASGDGAFTADQIASAYRFTDLYSSGAEGQGQTIALYELESFDPGDVAAYQGCYGTSAAVTPVAVDGGPTGSVEGSGEAALDIEQAIGLAPKANFLVYEGPNSTSNAPGSGPYDTLSAIIAQDRANVISISWGQCEQAQGANVLDAEQTLLEEAATQGQSVVSATGDQGSEDCNDPNTADTGLAVDDPGSQPFVTGVGGTSLQLGPPQTESVWNRPGSTSGTFVEQGGAGGGGLSDRWSMPGYQLSAAGSLNVIGPYSGCSLSGGRCREVPDVAADADPTTGYLIYWNGQDSDNTMPSGWQAVGGTSAAAPLWAALLADANSTSACRGSAIGFANPALYHAAGTGYSDYFTDVLSGNNDFLGVQGGLFPAGPGYDMASGLGSPKAGALAMALCVGALRVNSPGRQLATVGQPVLLHVTTTALPGTRPRFYATNLPPGLAISASTGRISGRPKRIGTWRTGVAALDQNLSLRGAFFYWHVGGPPTISAAKLSGVATGQPRLVLTVTAGRAAPWLSVVSLRLPRGLKFARRPRWATLTFPGSRRVRYSARVAGGRLRIVLASPVWRIKVTTGHRAVRATGRLAADVQGRRRSLVTIAVVTSNRSGYWAEVRTRLRPLS